MNIIKKTNWRKNIKTYYIDSALNWFYIPIGVWVLIWPGMFGFSKVALSQGISLLVGSLLELPSGALADLIGRRKTVIIGRFLLFLGYLQLFWSHSFFSFLLWQILYQVDCAMSSGAQSALLYDSLKENNQVDSWYKKTEANAFMYNTLGMALGAILSGWLFKLGKFVPYDVMILVTFFGFIASLFYQEPSIDSEKFTLKSYLKQNRDGFRHIFENEHIRAVSIFTLLVNFVAWCGVWYYYEPRLADGLFDAKIFALLVSGTYLIRAFGTRLVNVIDKNLKLEHQPIFLAGFQTLASFFTLFTGKFGAISSVYLRKFSDGYRQPTVIALQNDQIKSKYRATSLSALSLVLNLSMALVGWGLGLLLDSIGARSVLLLFAVFGLVAVVPSSFYLSKVIKKNHNLDLS